MTAFVIDIRTRRPLVAEAVRRPGYEAEVADGYSPRVLPIPKQKPRVNCVAPVWVVTLIGREEL